MRKEISKIKEPINLYIDLDGTLFEWCEGEDYRKPHYFRNLPVHKNVMEAIKEIMKNSLFKPIFATAVLNDEAIEDKRISLNEIGFSDLPMIAIPYGKSKDDFLPGERKILIDDYNQNLYEFSGIPIKLINNVNHKSKSWTGLSVKYDDSPEEIVNAIITAAKTSEINK